jgi:hypothetical protein
MQVIIFPNAFLTPLPPPILQFGWRQLPPELKQKQVGEAWQSTETPDLREGRRRTIALLKSSD